VYDLSEGGGPRRWEAGTNHFNGFNQSIPWEGPMAVVKLIRVYRNHHTLYRCIATVRGYLQFGIAGNGQICVSVRARDCRTCCAFVHAPSCGALIRTSSHAPSSCGLCWREALRAVFRQAAARSMGLSLASAAALLGAEAAAVSKAESSEDGSP